MQSTKLPVAAHLPGRSAVSTCALIALAIVPTFTRASGEADKKPALAKIERQFIVFSDSVVIEQWPHTLKLVNPPQNLTLLNPGQCIRIGVVATGDDRDSYLEKTQLSFHVNFAGQSQDHPLEPLGGTKQIKPEGGDMVTAALAAANINNPFLTTASLGASAANWCVPADAQDGTATIDAETDSPSGHKKLEHAKIVIESFETGSKRIFENGGEVDKFLMGYHYQPDSSRLYPALQFFAADEKWRSQRGALETAAATFGAALRENPAAAKDFMARIAKQTRFTRAFGMLALLQGGYDIDPVLNTMNEEDRQKFANHPILPDPFDFSHLEDIGTRLDMLWSIFMSTGRFEPVQKISSALAWQPDWIAFDKARQSSNPPKEWTPSIGRAVGYGAAGWALGSFQSTDPLAADYIEFMIASPDTPGEIRTLLRGLQTNQDFKWKWQDKK
jgi:hypothetical protein